MEKVLVGVPTYKYMKYCEEEFFEAIKNLSYSNYDVLIIENSEDDDYFNELKKCGFKVIKDKTSEKNKLLRLVSSRNLIIEYALKNNYDYILMMDSDVIPPKDIIERLLAHSKDIVSGLYFNFMMDSGRPKILPVAWRGITEEEFEEIKKVAVLPAIVKSHEDLKRHLTPEEIDTNELLEVRYPSNGCMLISKNVFEKVRYGLLDMTGIKASTTEDVYFIKKAIELGFKAYCDTSLKCFHHVLKKYKKNKNGNFMHPIDPNYNEVGEDLLNKDFEHYFIK